MPEDIRVGSPLGSLFVKDPDEPQNRMTKYSIVQGEYRDTFTIETDPTRNEGIIKPMKVGRTGAMTSDVELGAPSIPKTCPGAAPMPEAIRGACLGQLRAGHVLMETVTPELGKGSQGGRVDAFGWVTPKADLEERIWGDVGGHWQWQLLTGVRPTESGRGWKVLPGAQNVSRMVTQRTEGPWPGTTHLRWDTPNPSAHATLPADS